MASQLLSIQQTYFIRASVWTVFQAISEPKWLVRWFLHSAELRPVKGTEYEFVWRGGYRHRGQVLAYVRNRRLSLSWPNRLGRSAIWTRATFTLRQQGRGTLLALRHVGYPNTGGWVRIYGQTQYGWSYFLMNLKSVLEHGHDLRSDLDGM